MVHTVGSSRLCLLRCVPAVVLLLCLLSPRRAAADHQDKGNGNGFGLGPVMAFRFPSGGSLGWELGGMLGSPLVKASIGGTYAVRGATQGPPMHHYIAYEPWLFVGATLGVALASDPNRLQAMYGLWEGVPLSMNGNNDAGHQWLLTIAVGWRGFGGDQELYFSPKLWWADLPDFNS